MIQQPLCMELHLMTTTRPDLSFAVGLVARFMHNPGQQHWVAVKRIFRYLKGTHALGLGFHANGCDFKGYADADWAGDTDDRKSTSGYLFMFADGPIAWGSKKQRAVTLSTGEAELVALCLAAQEGIWMLRLIGELFGKEMNILSIADDNQACIKMTKNPGYKGRAKHIDIKFHFVKDLVKEGKLQVYHVSSEKMLADGFTKPMPRERHNNLIQQIGMIQVRTSSQGGVLESDA